MYIVYQFSLNSLKAWHFPIMKTDLINLWHIDFLWHLKALHLSTLYLFKQISNYPWLWHNDLKKNPSMEEHIEVWMKMHVFQCQIIKSFLGGSNAHLCMWNQEDNVLVKHENNLKLSCIDTEHWVCNMYIIHKILKICQWLKLSMIVFRTALLHKK